MNQTIIQLLFTPKNTDSSHSSRSNKNAFFQPAVQTKLAIGKPGDQYEVEADNTADKIVANSKESDVIQQQSQQQPFFPPKPVLQPRQDVVQQKESGEQEKEQEAEEEPLSESVTPAVQTSLLPPEEPVQRNTANSPKEFIQKKADGDSTVDITQRLNASKGNGAPMDKETQAEMSSGFGTDFSNVRVHTDSNAVQMNKEMGAQAFTNGNDVYFNSGKYNPSSDEGKHLLAHELTHTVQQGATPAGSAPTVQAKLDEYEKPEHGKNTESRLNNEFEERTGGEPPEPAEEPPSRSEKQGEMEALDGPTKPRIDESAIQAPIAREQQAQTEEKIENPEKLVNDEVPEETELPPEEAPSIETVIQLYEAEAQNSLVQMEQVPAPEEPEEVTPPEGKVVTDADGSPVEPDVAGDLAHATALAQISEIRMQGHLVKQQGTNHKKVGLGMQEKVNTLMGRVSEGEKTIGEMNEAVTARREVTEQGQEGLRVSEEKQTRFEQEAPAFKEKIDTTKNDSTEVVSEGQDIKSQNESTKPEDPEDRGNSDEAGGKLGELNDSTTSIDTTLGTVQTDFDQAIEQNTAAKQKNTESSEKLNDTTQKLDQADAHITMLEETNRTAKTDIESKQSEPQEMQTQADEMIASGDAAIEDSFRMEAELAAIEEKYESALRGVKSEEAPQVQQKSQDTIIQRYPNGGDYAEEGRLNVFGNTDINDYNPVNAIANTLTDRRSEEIQRIRDQRSSELETLTASTERPISEMTGMQRVGLGLQMLGRRFWDWATSINMLDISLFTINLINPITYVLGVGAGLGLVINGTYNFFRDLFRGDIFGAIKSAGDAATGVAVVAGSITGLAMLISLAVTVAMFFGFGLALGPVILPLMAKIMAFCGPIAFWAGITAAALNVISGIKSLVDLGSAQTAEELQAQVNDLQSDSVNTLTSLLMAFVGRAGGRAGAPGAGTPVTPGAGLVMLGEFGTSIADRIAAFLSPRQLAYEGVALRGPVPGYAPQPIPGIVRPGIGTGTGTGIGTGVGTGAGTGATVTAPNLATSAATLPAAGTATQVATQTAQNNQPAKRYKWWVSHSRLVYTNQSMNNGYLSQAHHVWPKNIGGPHAGQQLLQMADRIHSREIHGVQGPFGNIHTYLTNAIKGNPTFAPVLGTDVITHQIGVGNRKLIAAMKNTSNPTHAAALKTFVKNTLMSYYAMYQADSNPIMPTTAYQTGLDQAENLI